MPKRKYLRGFTDPISVIGVLFLVVTLGIGFWTVKDKNISLNIKNEASSCMTECRKESGARVCDCRCNGNCTRPDSHTDKEAVKRWGITPPPSSVPTVNVNQSSCTGNVGIWCSGCGGFCLSGSYTGGGCNQAQQERCGQAPVVPNIVCNSENEGIVVVYSSGNDDYRKCVNGRWEANGCNGQKCKITDLTPEAVPTYLKSDYQREISNLQQAQQQRQQQQKTECENSGRIWLNNQCVTSETRIETVDNDPRPQEQNLITNLVTNYKDALGNIVHTDKKTINIQNYSTVEKTNSGFDRSIDTIIRDTNNNLVTSFSTPTKTQYFNTVEKVDEGFIRDLNTIIRNANSNEILNYLTQSIVPTQSSNIQQQGPLTTIPNYQYFGYDSLQDCIEQNKGGGKGGAAASKCHGNRSVTTASINNFARCQNSNLSPTEQQVCNIKMSEIYNAPIIGRYIQAYAPENVTYMYELNGYRSVGDCLSDPSNFGRHERCSGYMPTKEQFASSVSLGTTMTSVLTLPYAAGTYVAGGLTGAQAISLTFAGLNTMQTGNAIDTCTIDNTSEHCKYSAIMAATGWFNIGSSGFLSYALSNAQKLITTATRINTGVNLANVGVDAYDIFNSCGSGQFAGTANCALALIGTAVDFGQGVSDIHRAISNHPSPPAPSKPTAQNGEEIIDLVPDATGVFRTVNDPNRIVGLLPSGVLTPASRFRGILNNTSWQEPLPFQPPERIATQRFVGFLPNWTNVGTGPISNTIFGNPIPKTLDSVDSVIGITTRNTADEIVANLSPDFQAGPKVVDVTADGIPPATEIKIPQKVANWWSETTINPKNWEAEKFVSFWKQNIYDSEIGFLPNWTSIGVNSVTKTLFGDPTFVKPESTDTRSMLFQNALNGAFVTGAGFSPLTYVTGSAMALLYLVDDYYGWDMWDKFVDFITPNEKLLLTKSIGVNLNSMLNLNNQDDTNKQNNTNKSESSFLLDPKISESENKIYSNDRITALLEAKDSNVLYINYLLAQATREFSNDRQASEYIAHLKLKLQENLNPIEYTALINDSEFLTALNRVEQGYMLFKNEGKIQCLFWGLLTQGIPGMEGAANIDYAEFNPNVENIFGFIDKNRPRGSASTQEVVTYNLSVVYPAGQNTAYHFNDFDLGVDGPREGDAYFIKGKNHVGRILEIYLTPNGEKIFVTAESNRNGDGEPNIYILTEQEFLDTIGIRNTWFLRDNDYPNGTGPITQAPQSLLDIIQTNP